MPSDVFQSSQLGPIYQFFLMLFNDIAYPLRSKKMYDDDLKLYSAVNLFDDPHLLQDNLNRVH